MCLTTISRQPKGLWGQSSVARSRYHLRRTTFGKSEPMDTLTREQRRRRMALIRSKDTKPELCVRQLVYGLGYRYRLNRRDLPGCPDLVFASLRKIILVHGCFWHQHHCASGNRTPKSRRHFWREKLGANKVRDQVTIRKLRRGGWRVLVVWECQIKNADRLAARIAKFLDRS